MKTLEQIEVGDRVWVGDSLTPHSRLLTVKKVTPKQIAVDDGNRYRRDTGRAMGAAGYYVQRISVATPEECERWDAEEAERRREAEERRAVRERIDAKREELNALFGAGAYVSESNDPDVEPWEVHFFLSEEGVRRLAALWEAAVHGERATD